MDALLIALIACMLAEMGDRSQILTAALARRFRRTSLVIAGLVFAVVANVAIAAYAGQLIAAMLSFNARSLFMALGFVAVGLGMLMSTKMPDLLAGWRIGAFATSALGLFILGFGESAQFLIMGISTARGDPLLAAIGGALGIIVACLAAIVVPQIPAIRFLPSVRRFLAGVFLLTGGTLAVMALGLT
ncbi:MAG: TMEM165/GDT1 family protein [Sphingobium sp.]